MTAPDWPQICSCRTGANPSEKFPVLLEYLPYRKDDGTGGNWLPGELWTKHMDEIHQTTTWEWHGGQETTEFPWGRERHQDKLRFKVKDDLSEPPTAHGEGETIVELPERVLVWRDPFDLSNDKANFYYHFTRVLLENGKKVREKTWDESIPRDHQ